MMNIANMHDKLVKHGWFLKTIRLAAPVFFNGTDRPTSTVPKIAALTTPTKLSVQPTKRQGIVIKTHIQDSLLKVGWFKKKDEDVVHGPRSNGNVDLVPENITDLDLWLKKYHKGKLSESSETKSAVTTDDVAVILDLICRKKETVSSGKRNQGMVDKADFRKNLLSKGWYAATAKNITHASDGKRKTTLNVHPNKFSDYKTRVDTPTGKNNNILLDGQRKTRNKSGTKYQDKRSKTSKPHKKAINNLFQEGWTMVNRTGYQVTLAKLPEREPPKECITESVSKSAGIKFMVQTKYVTSENGDVESNITNFSKHTTSLRRFLRKSKKMCRRIFTCGRNEE